MIAAPRAAVEEAARARVVRGAVRAVVDGALEAARARELEALRGEAARLGGEAAREAAAWAEERAALDEERTRLEREALEEEGAREAAEVVRREAEEAARRAGAEEARLEARREELTARRGLTALPPAALAHVASFLEVREVARATAACRRWRRRLDGGAVWRAALRQSRAAEEAERLRRQEDGGGQVEVRRHVQVDLAPEGQRSLDKESMFRLGMERVQGQFMAASAQRDEVSSRRAADREVVTFLERQAGELRHQLGLVSVEHGDWRTRIERTSRAKARLSERATELEERVRAAREGAAALRERAAASAEAEESRIQMLTELRDLSELSRSPEERERDQAVRAQAKELKAQKRMLVKAVKLLRSELDTATKMRDTYSVKLRKLREEEG